MTSTMLSAADKYQLLRDKHTTAHIEEPLDQDEVQAARCSALKSYTFGTAALAAAESVITLGGLFMHQKYSLDTRPHSTVTQQIPHNLGDLAVGATAFIKAKHGQASKRTARRLNRIVTAAYALTAGYSGYEVLHSVREGLITERPGMLSAFALGSSAVAAAGNQQIYTRYQRKLDQVPKSMRTHDDEHMAHHASGDVIQSTGALVFGMVPQSKFFFDLKYGLGRDGLISAKRTWTDFKETRERRRSRHIDEPESSYTSEEITADHCPHHQEQVVAHCAHDHYDKDAGKPEGFWKRKAWKLRRLNKVVDNGLERAINRSYILATSAAKQAASYVEFKTAHVKPAQRAALITVLGAAAGYVIFRDASAIDAITHQPAHPTESLISSEFIGEAATSAIAESSAINDSTEEVVRIAEAVQTPDLAVPPEMLTIAPYNSVTHEGTLWHIATDLLQEDATTARTWEVVDAIMADNPQISNPDLIFAGDDLVIGEHTRSILAPSN